MLRRLFRWMAISIPVWMAAVAGADVRPPRILCDHMVIQRDAPVPLWGTAEAGEKVTVQFAGQRHSLILISYPLLTYLLQWLPRKGECAGLCASCEPKPACREESIAMGTLIVGKPCQSGRELNVQAPVRISANGYGGFVIE